MFFCKGNLQCPFDVYYEAFTNVDTLAFCQMCAKKVLY